MSKTTGKEITQNQEAWGKKIREYMNSQYRTLGIKLLKEIDNGSKKEKEKTQTA